MNVRSVAVGRMMSIMQDCAGKSSHSILTWLVPREDVRSGIDMSEYSVALFACSVKSALLLLSSEQVK